MCQAWRVGVSSVHILLARIQPCGLTRLQGMLGNVVQQCTWEGEERFGATHNGLVWHGGCASADADVAGGGGRGAVDSALGGGDIWVSCFSDFLPCNPG